jgi:hypothetical protein
MQKNIIKHLPKIVLFIAAIVLVIYNVEEKKDNPTANAINSFKGNTENFNRNPQKIIFTKHAICRMGCRSIDSLEVDEILKKGKINYKKSDTTATKACRKKYALEGKTRDNQQVRIIFSPCENTQTVVTVIDTDTDWACDCK